MTNIYFGLLSFIPLISDLEVIEDAVLNEGMELLENQTLDRWVGGEIESC